MTAIDFRSEREKFPTLGERTYLASQCFGAFPREMLSDLHEYERTLTLRNRAIDLWAERFGEIHSLSEQLIEAPPGSVFLRDSATAAQAAIAAAIEPKGDRTRIVVGAGDFHSSRFLWHAQQHRGFEIVEVDSYHHDYTDPATYTGSIDERVAIVALSLVSPRSGALLDVRPVVDAAHRAGAIVVIDAFQAMGVLPVRVREIGADVLVGGFHKWVGGGGMGIAFGYVSPDLANKLDPVYPGWMGHSDMLGFHDRFTPAKGAARFQQGGPAVEPIYSSRAGLRWVLEVGVDAIRARNLELTDRLIQRAQRYGMAIRTPLAASRRGGMVCLDVANGEAIVKSIGAAGMDVDFRPGAGIRIGPHACVSEDECDLVMDAIYARLQ